MDLPVGVEGQFVDADRTAKGVSVGKLAGVVAKGVCPAAGEAITN
jgi:hypothetical protein